MPIASVPKLGYQFKSYLTDPCGLGVFCLILLLLMISLIAKKGQGVSYSSLHVSVYIHRMQSREV